VRQKLKRRDILRKYNNYTDMRKRKTSARKAKMLKGIRNRSKT